MLLIALGRCIVSVLYNALSDWIGSWIVMHLEGVLLFLPMSLHMLALYVDIIIGVMRPISVAFSPSVLADWWSDVYIELKPDVDFKLPERRFSVQSEREWIELSGVVCIFLVALFFDISIVYFRCGLRSLFPLLLLLSLTLENFLPRS
jgi:hypothetical protein